AGNRQPAFRIQRNFRSTTKHRWSGRAVSAHFPPLLATMGQPLGTVNRLIGTFVFCRQSLSGEAGTPDSAPLRRAPGQRPTSEALSLNDDCSIAARIRKTVRLSVENHGSAGGIVTARDRA